MAFKVGLELHVYLRTPTKLFCNCPVDFHADPNTTTCPICTGQPGSKPLRPSKPAINHAILIAHMLGCTINKTLFFQRKHYSWPDMPNGFQKTMSGSYGLPVGTNGHFRGINITECHLEEDPARWDPATGTVDYNRSGYPLMEIVTEPDFTDVQTVRQWLEDLVLSLAYLRSLHITAGVKGDVNVSIAPKYERVEIKNINSFTAVVDAIEYEVKRQQEQVSQGHPIPPQTRAWSDEQQETVFMRKKESASDYRFIPEPDLPTIFLDDEYIKAVTATLPFMPWEKKQQLVKLGLSESDAQVLINDADLVDIYDAVQDIDPLFTAKWVRREVVRVAHFNKKTVADLRLDKKQLHKLLSLMKNGIITENVGQKLIEQLAKKSFDVEAHVKDQGLASMGDSDDLKGICAQVITEQSQAVEDYKQGSEKSLHFLVGQVMRKTRGAAKPDVVLAVFKELL